MQQHTQTGLNFSSTPAGDAREAGREETESLATANDPESPASLGEHPKPAIRDHLKTGQR
jgi:hypothetical protein